MIRPGAIGDFIVSLPAIECLRCDYLEVWAAAQNLPLARVAQHARSIASTGLDLLELGKSDARLLAALRSFDSIISWYGAKRPEFRDCVAALGLPLHFFPALPDHDSRIHAGNFYLDQVRSLAECSSDGIPRIQCPRAPGDFAVIHPFSGSPKKCWALERFQDLANRLGKRMPVAWCAGPEDDFPGAVRFADLYDLACWLASARIYIGNDSGPTHLAAAAGTPVVAIFGASDPAVWAPRGPNVTVAAAPSLEALTVDQIESLIYYILGDKS